MATTITTLVAAVAVMFKLAREELATAASAAVAVAVAYQDQLAAQVAVVLETVAAMAAKILAALRVLLVALEVLTLAVVVVVLVAGNPMVGTAAPES